MIPMEYFIICTAALLASGLLAIQTLVALMLVVLGVSLAAGLV